MKRRLQPAPASPEQAQGDLHVPGESPYLLTAEAARLLKFDRRGDGTERPITAAMQLFREWATRNHVPPLHRGRTLLYDRRVIAAVLKLKRHSGTVTSFRQVEKVTSLDGKAITR